MISDLMPTLYVAALYTVARLVHLRGNMRQGLVLDVLALNWLACSIANEVVGYPRVVAAYIVVDLVSALWLSRNVRGRVSGIAEIFYIALILFNAAYFFRHAFTPWTHWAGLSILSWGQLALVTGGIVRHDVVTSLDLLAARLGIKRHMAVGNREIEG